VPVVGYGRLFDVPLPSGETRTNGG
jgi:hypothetical protein